MRTTMTALADVGELATRMAEFSEGVGIWVAAGPAGPDDGAGTDESVTVATELGSRAREIAAVARALSTEAGCCFVISTLFVRECYDYLMKSEVESLHYISGVSVGPLRTLDRLIAFRLAEQEIAYVRGDIVSSVAALIMLSERGFELHGHAHCHPGSGPGATLPSRIDYAHQHRLEAGGYTAIGMILARDGHFRFFSKAMPFHVHVVGTDVTMLGPKCYRLEMEVDHDDDDQGRNSDAAAQESSEGPIHQPSGKTDV